MSSVSAVESAMKSGTHGNYPKRLPTPKGIRTSPPKATRNQDFHAILAQKLVKPPTMPKLGSLRDFAKMAVSVPALSGMIQRGLASRAKRWEAAGRPADLVAATARRLGIGRGLNRKLYERLEKLAPGAAKREEALLAAKAGRSEFGRRVRERVSDNFGHALDRLIAKHFRPKGQS
ncbi:MAG: hypothetical protein ABFE07_28700 [Armatimonadia bacterium]